MYGTMGDRYKSKLESESLYQFYNKDKISRASKRRAIYACFDESGNYTLPRSAGSVLQHSSALEQSSLHDVVRDTKHDMSPVKRICVFEHSVMTHFNCACPAIQRGKGSGFLSEGSS